MFENDAANENVIVLTLINPPLDFRRRNAWQSYISMVSTTIMAVDTVVPPVLYCRYTCLPTRTRVIFVLNINYYFFFFYFFHGAYKFKCCVEHFLFNTPLRSTPFIRSPTRRVVCWPASIVLVASLRGERYRMSLKTPKLRQRISPYQSRVMPPYWWWQLLMIRPRHTTDRRRSDARQSRTLSPDRFLFSMLT